MRQNGDRSDKPGIDTGFGLQTAVLHIVFPEQSLDNQANRQKGRACGKQAAQKPHQIADKAHFFGNDKADSQKQAEKQQDIRHIIIRKGAFEVTAFFERFDLFFQPKVLFALFCRFFVFSFIVFGGAGRCFGRFRLDIGCSFCWHERSSFFLV